MAGPMGGGGEERHLYPDLCEGEGLLGAVVTAELLALLVVVARAGVERFDWGLLGTASLMALWVALLAGALLCLARPWLARRGRAAASLLAWGAVLCVTALVSALGQLALGFARGLPLAVAPATVLDHLLIAAIPAGLLLHHLYLQQLVRVKERAELESRIQALQARIRPHFLFNSMNIIASLIGSDPERAETVVEDLSDLFRHALADNHTLVPLREELNLCRRYLAIEQLRLGERLRSRWEVDDYGTDVLIPSLTLQPVLENAVYHGIQLLPEGGEIAVRVGRRDGILRIEVRNPRNPRLAHNRGNRMALDNVRNRLRAHFGGSADVVTEIHGQDWVTVITYPVGG